MRVVLKKSHELFVAQVSGRKIPVVIKRNARARRLILRIDEGLGLPVITLPSRTALARGEDFLRENLLWVEDRLSRLSPAIPFCDGGVFPLRGVPCRIEYRGGRGLIALRKEPGGFVLSVPGGQEFVSRRVTDWLKREARKDLEAAVARHCRTLGRKASAVHVGDAKSRWGSCSASGTLTFSWRLVLAPPAVLDYLAAHEAAHLREMNHGPRFWTWVERLYPRHRSASDWLHTHGPRLAAIGRTA
jgi:predicted metal-dependent hydrolase